MSKRSAVTDVVHGAPVATTQADVADGPAGRSRSLPDGRPGHRQVARWFATEPGLRLFGGVPIYGMLLGLVVSVAVFLLFALIPAAANVLISFTDYTSLPTVPTSFVGFANYATMLSSQNSTIVESLVATVIFAVGVTVVQNVAALFLAHRLIGGGRWTALMRILVFLPIVLGVTVVGLVWLLLFDPSGSPASSVLSLFGTNSAFFGSSHLALPLVIIVQVWQNLGFTMIVFFGGLAGIPRSIFEASTLDGAGPWTRFRRITWPLMAPSVTANVTFAVIGSLTTYNLIFVLTGGGYNTDTLGMLAFNSAFGSTANLGYGAAVTTLLFVVTFILAMPLVSALRARERRILGV